jgi:hypothetical protein
MTQRALELFHHVRKSLQYTSSAALILRNAGGMMFLDAGTGTQASDSLQYASSAALILRSAGGMVSLDAGTGTHASDLCMIV